MKNYTIEIHHYQEIFQPRNSPTEILEFSRDGLTQRDWENICISLTYGIDSVDYSVQAEIYVDGEYQFIVTLHRNLADLKLLHLDMARLGKFYNIRSYREVA